MKYSEITNASSNVEQLTVTSVDLVMKTVCTIIFINEAVRFELILVKEL